MSVLDAESAALRAGRARINAHLAYRPDIDGIRALAVLPIVIFHAFPGAIRGGFAGVDIFFVISGYLITGIILGGIDGAGFSFADFYERRMRRIFPGLLIVLVACYAFGWFALLADEYARLGKHIAGAAVFALNFILAGEAGYFDVSASAKPLLHLWSLAVEEQFYLVWPAILVAVVRLRLSVLGTIIVAALFSFGANIALALHAPVEDFYLPVTRAWELMAGALLLVLTDARPSNRGVVAGILARWPNACALAGLGAIGVSLFGPAGNYAYPGWWGVLPVLGTLLLIGAGPGAQINRVALAHPVAVWFGLISYPLYLWHWPLLSYLTIVDTAQPEPVLRWAALIASVALAWLTYRLVERPIRHSRGHAVPVVLFALLLTIGYIGYATFAAQGLTGRLGHGLAFRFGPEYTELVNSIEVGKDYGAHRVAACDHSEASDEFCQQDTQGPANAVVLGDSHARMLFPGLVRNASTDMSWMLLSKNGCSPLFGMQTNPAYIQAAGSDVADCERFLRAAIDRIKGDDAIKVVLISAAVRILNSQLTASDEQARRSEIAALADKMLHTVADLESAGKRVALLIDNPWLAEPKDCFPNRFWTMEARRAACSMAARDYAAKVADYLGMVREVAAADPRLQIIDETPALCPDGTCSVMLSGKSLYSFSDHLSDYGNDVVGRKVVAALARDRSAD